MVPETYTNYFLGSTGASAALIGLLFVAISLAPESIFGHRATAERRTQAGSAFTALLNAFFISLVALIPGTNLGYVTLAMGGSALINTLSLGRHLWRDRPMRHNLQSSTLLFGSIVIYMWELWFAMQLLQHPRSANNVNGLAYLLLGAYSLGLGRAWELLGAQNEGLFTLLGLRGDRREGRGSADDGEQHDVRASENEGVPHI